ncbi:hypothetical protein DQ353_18075 [Arthrobacter sp. AQ5-05]|uniref:FliO/MopB family protein n=1 Tax=Arthrobacter sp. AQ5-05 TaxID=2184581 RepID=UPI000DCD67F8|nr:flagellar biosynthetic protein FliO [Arthrobacter sp. AQ5-05]RAX47891.1 hypothetical protein DQ353_18075 [Arthrobacter sp. AQ5-05]
MESFFLLLRVLVSLAAVFGLLFYLRKRLLPRFGTPRASQLNVVERQGLGPKSSVVLLDVQGRRYLLGVAEASISVLDSFEAPEPAASQIPDPVAETPRSFAAVLESLLAPAAVQPALPPAADHQDIPNHGPEREPAAGSPGPSASPLAGSILSPETWRRAVAALRTGRGA